MPPCLNKSAKGQCDNTCDTARTQCREACKSKTKGAEKRACKLGCKAARNDCKASCVACPFSPYLPLSDPLGSGFPGSRRELVQKPTAVQVEGALTATPEAEHVDSTVTLFGGAAAAVALLAFLAFVSRSSTRAYVRAVVGKAFGSTGSSKSTAAILTPPSTASTCSKPSEEVHL